MKNSEIILSRKNMVNILSQSEEFIVIGLTGRTGAGCTEASKIFGYTFKELELPRIEPGSEGIINNAERERRICQRYAGAHWLKFDIINSRTIISTFLLKHINKFVEKINSSVTNTNDEKISTKKYTKA